MKTLWTVVVIEFYGNIVFFYFERVSNPLWWWFETPLDWSPSTGPVLQDNLSSDNSSEDILVFYGRRRARTATK